MEIIEYNDKYQESVKDLLEELQLYIAAIDEEGFNVLGIDYRNKYFESVMDEIKKYDGIMYLAKENDTILGLVVGVINNDEEDTYNFKAPKRGRITELVVSITNRGQGIGKMLMQKIEDYFRLKDCKGILLGVFAYNKVAIDFYKKDNYKFRTMDMYKEI